jgi:hypothetical protein
MGRRIMEIHLASYLKPSRNEGSSDSTLVFSGINKTTVATRKIVNISRYISQSLEIHFIVNGTERGIFS